MILRCQHIRSTEETHEPFCIIFIAPPKIDNLPNYPEAKGFVDAKITTGFSSDMIEPRDSL